MSSLSPEDDGVRGSLSAAPALFVALECTRFGEAYGSNLGRALFVLKGRIPACRPGGPLRFMSAKVH